jgi:ABC-type sugar transport system permease subunit
VTVSPASVASSASSGSSRSSGSPRSGGSGAPRRRRRSSRPAIVGLLLAPSLIVFGVFVFWPLVWALRTSVVASDPFGRNTRWVGLDQYERAFTDSGLVHSLGVTGLYALVTVPTGLALGCGLALAATQRLRGVGWFRAVCTSTIAVSVAVSALVVSVLLNPSLGLVNWLVRQLGGHGVDWLRDPTWALPAVALSTVWASMGVTFLVVLAGLQAIPDDLLDAARVDGAGAWRRTSSITLPLLAPTLLLAAVVLTINAFQTFGQIDLLTQGGPLDRTRVVVYSIYDEAFRRFDDGAAAVQTVVLFLVIAILSTIQVRLLSRRVFYAGS